MRIDGDEPESIQSRQIGKAYSTEEIRKSHPKAYSPWDDGEDEELVSHYIAGRSHKEISNLLGRKVGAIRSRLIKLGLGD
ncbi:MAG: hypothetical protein HYX22_02430 [Candidatus Yanofskybacteria bacterium]|nr:hypothetical protein [Candidatus Yanofskybacteria bacterium]